MDFFEDLPSCGCSGCNHEHKHEHEHNHTQEHSHNKATANEEHNHTAEGSLRRDLLMIGIAVVIVALSFVFPNIWVKNIMWAAATLFSSYSLLLEGLKNTFKLRLDELSLLLIAVLAAFIIGEGFEAALVAILFKTGTYFEALAVNRSKKEINKLSGIIAETANVIGEDGSVTVVQSKLLQPGAHILIKPGEKVPVDCVVIEGSSLIDTSALTGESVPQDASAGDALISGSMNQSGLLTCRTTSDFVNSTAYRIMKLVDESAQNKAKSEGFITRFAKVYTPVVIVLAVFVAVLPPLFGIFTWSQAIHNALTFLVAACPCALVIATPLGFFSAIGGATKTGVLVKGGKYIEALAKADIIAFDKTGTLTNGVLRIASVQTASGHSKEEVLRLASALEQYSTHPIAKTIVESLAAENGHNVALPMLTDVTESPGLGVSARLGGKTLLCGSARLMEQNHINLDGLEPASVYLAQEGKIIGQIFMADTLKTESAETVARLKSHGITPVLLTGDNARAAQEAATLCGIEDVYPALMPKDKADRLEAYKSRGATVLFVGDGVNDAPVLAAAHAGISMGMGSDTAIEVSDIVLVSNNLSGIPRAIEHARHCMRTIRFNVAFSIAVKILVLALGACGLAPMWLAVFADVGVTVLAVLNATRLLRPKKN